MSGIGKPVRRGGGGGGGRADRGGSGGGSGACLFYRGRDLTRLPLVDRKRVLQEPVRFDDVVRFTPVLERSFASLYQRACREGAEGLIGKREQSPYRPGRSDDWVKLKCVSRQEFVVGGWTDPQGSREQLGALLVGYFDGEEKLRYAGKVGTGYDRHALERLARELAARAQRTSPFAAEGGLREAAVHWVAPTLVVEIGFSEWTPDGLLRHPRFRGLRMDKEAGEVRREGAKESGSG